MYFYIVDSDYKKRIKRFIQMNYARYCQLEMIDDLAALNHLSDAILITDDLTINLETVDVHYVVSSDDGRANYHYKYQNFKQLLAQLGAVSNCERRQAARIIVVTSLLGGVGKSSMARAITNMLGRSRESLLLRLFVPKCSSKQTLSQFIASQRHNNNFNLAAQTKHVDGIATLDGFFAAAELADNVLGDVFVEAKRLFDSSIYREIVVDATALPYCRSLFKFADHCYVLRSRQRRSEEAQLLADLQLDLADWQQIICSNSTDDSTLYQLPDSADRQAYQEAVRNILIEDGLYEY